MASAEALTESPTTSDGREWWRRALPCQPETEWLRDSCAHRSGLVRGVHHRGAIPDGRSHRLFYCGRKNIGSMPPVARAPKQVLSKPFAPKRVARGIAV